MLLCLPSSRSRPLTVLIFNSLKTTIEFGRNPLGIPHEPAVRQFREAWERGDYAISSATASSIRGATVIGVCIISGLAAYALSRLEFPAELV